MSEEQSPYFEGIEQKPDNTLMTEYRLVFRSDAGRKVLADILVNFCHFGAYLNPEDKAMVGQSNVGISIMGRLGVFTSGKEDVISALLNVPVQE